VDTRKGTYVQRGRHGPIHCEIFLNGEFLSGAFGHLTFIRETRRGEAVAPTPMWQEPTGWLRVPDLR
jgi:hypothetical protein